MSRSKRERSSLDTSFESSLPGPLLMLEQVNELISSISDFRSVLLETFRTKKVTERYTRLQDAITSIDTAFHKLASAYLHQLAVESTARSMEQLLHVAADVVNDAGERLKRAADRPQPSYAAVLAAGSARGDRLANKITLSRGKTIPIARGERIVIGPSKEAEEKLPTSSATKLALQKAINPTELKLNARISYGPKNLVILEGRDHDPEASLCSLLERPREQELQKQGAPEVP